MSRSASESSWVVVPDCGMQVPPAHASLKAAVASVVGPVKVGNFTVWSFPHLGGLGLVAAAFLAVAGSRKSVA